MKILQVGHRDPNHSKFGGYDNISMMPGADNLWDYQALFGFLKPNRAGKRINLFFQQLKAIHKRNDYDVIHFYYGDWLRVRMPKKGKAAMVATVHMDIAPGVTHAGNFLSILRSMDGIVTLSSAQQRQLKDRYDIDSTFIPHGFNKPVFENVETDIDDDKVNIVISGTNYRDYDTMYDAIDYAAQHRKDIFFHLLGQSREVKERLADAKNAKCYPRLGDNEYYSLMQKCDYNLLPLTFATANNALLEAQALGVTSILPEISGIEDYAAKANIFYAGKEGLRDILSEIKKHGISKEITEHAKLFEWSNIYKQLQAYYKGLKR